MLVFLNEVIVRPATLNKLSVSVHVTARIWLLSALNYSIIPYSSIIFWLFLHTDTYLETVSALVSAVRHRLHVCAILQLTERERTSLIKHAFTYAAFCGLPIQQGRRRRSGWSALSEGLSRTNNLELNQLADQLELHYSHAMFGRSHLHVATYHFTDVIENA